MNLRTASLAAVFLLPLQAGAQPVPVGSFPAKIVPEQATTLPLERGTVSDLADASRRLKRGDVVARVNVEKTEREREEMELQISKEKLAKRDELRKLESQRSKLHFYLNSLSDEERKFAKDMGGEDMQPSKEALADIEERISLLQREMDRMPQRKREEFERAHESMTVKMPYDGRLQYNITLPEDREKPFEYTASGSQPFATVCDDSAFYITINLNQTELTQLPPEQFSAEVALPDGKKLCGTFHHRRVEHNGSTDMLVYFFRLQPQDHETAYTMLGGNAKAAITFETGEDVRIESKAKLLNRPEAAESENWEELVQRMFPDYNIVLIAERDIVLRAKNAK
ncbi:MAG: hypothetical protein Q4C88_07025 [Akkermansia sp.]|nr:hypothetical protein [Akkermansia sp.]